MQTETSAGRGAIALLGFADQHGFAQEVYPIFPRKQFLLGRADVEMMLGVNDTTISNEHLRIRCVQFDEDVTWGVPPIVYVEDLSRNGTCIKRAQRGRSDNIERALDQINGFVPLLDGDRIYLNQPPSVFIQLRMEVESTNPPMASVTEREIEGFEREFKVIPQIIGSGGQGVVYAAIHQQTQRPLACKVLPRHGPAILRGRTNYNSSESSPSQSKYGSGHNLDSRLRRLEAEYQILKDITHPNIVAVEKIFITTHHVFIMEELMTGGDLLSFVENKGQRLGDAQSAVIIMQVLKAVEYLHDNDIVHRDIKPDNILMTSWRDETRVVLTDFGHAKRIGRADDHSKSHRMTSTVGTVGYTAPEVHKQNKVIPINLGYSKAVDLWSIGTITALLLTGLPMFAGDQGDDDWDSRQAKLRAAAQCDLSIIDLKKGEWAPVKRRGKDFVKALLVLDEEKRLTAKQALQHDWLSCPIYVNDLNAIYKTVTAGWTHQENSQSIVRVVDTSDVESSLPLSSSLLRPSPVKSAFFNNASIPEPSSSRRYSHLDFDISGLSQHGQGHMCESYEENTPQLEYNSLKQSSITQDFEKRAFQGSPELCTWPKTQSSVAPLVRGTEEYQSSVAICHTQRMRSARDE